MCTCTLKHYLNYHLFSKPNNIKYLISFLYNFSISFFSPCFSHHQKIYNHDYNYNDVVVLLSPAAKKIVYLTCIKKCYYLLPLLLYYDYDYLLNWKKTVNYAKKTVIWRILLWKNINLLCKIVSCTLYYLYLYLYHYYGNYSLKNGRKMLQFITLYTSLCQSINQLKQQHSKKLFFWKISSFKFFNGSIETKRKVLSFLFYETIIMIYSNSIVVWKVKLAT